MEDNKDKIDDSVVNTMTDDLKADQSDDADQLDKLDQVDGYMKEAPSSPPAITAKNQFPFLNLPPEIRIIIYAMVIADMPRTQDPNHPVGEFNLCQPTLAKKEKNFGICIYPKRHSEVDQVWQDFVDRFKAHTAGADGSHHLSRIQHLQVELWHPAFGPGFDHHRLQQGSGAFPFDMCNGVYIRFGAFARPLRHNVGVLNTDWTNRDAVRGLIGASIVESRHDWFPGRLERFWDTYPFERLVDLVMMIAGECKEAAGSLHIATSLPPLYSWF
ncbi:hypothetical protein INS49_014365 [Diaporthe citri]|uniref:uncharacterized protein n=1 Tax=Diaporthe citri TaxID=83186 RepID=UPI001C81E62D|nr:uncharacterized protein INS49_014365 [Diaporthe citri]KAG6358481.1 hypothetical protein INS49_014365 [Diaporthe citri]